MKGRRLSIYLVMLLSVISLASVGFASWTITDDFSTPVSGSIITDDAINASDIINTEIKVFKYFNSCFISEEIVTDEEGNKSTKVSPSDQGYIIITITLKDDEQLNKFSNPVLNLSFDQKQTNVDSVITKHEVVDGISNNGYITNITLNDETLADDQINFDDYQININCLMKKTVTKYIFKIQFTVNDNNRQAFFESLLYSNISFSTLVTIGGDINNE